MLGTLFLGDKSVTNDTKAASPSVDAKRDGKTMYLWLSL
jgi:hypothetical protein